jgi:predicted 2-oxoglutarate/Fe(II)-dependent dioxygenase YbiX
VKELPQDVQEQLLEALNERVLRPMAQRAGFDVAQLHYRDLFVVSYTTDAQPGLALHRDGSLLSFNVLLSSPTDFVGGGTRFPHLAAIMRPARGDAVVHSGSAVHEGVPITDGHRVLVVGFVESTRD